MKRKVLTIWVIVLCLGSIACWSSFAPIKNKNQVVFDQLHIVDKKANKLTKALYINLQKIAPDYILFGHQDDLAYGVQWKEWYQKKSDVKDVCGTYPAVFGWDLGKLGQRKTNIDSVSFQHMKKWMLEVYKMGGINTVSWHVDNFVTDGNTWDTGENVVKAILPGGEKHELYKARLDVMADFFKSLKSGGLFFKKNIPIIFRPFHEHTGAWFWWGQPHCTPDEYKALWQFTVKYLRDEKNVHNLLYCYSTDIFQDKKHYLECYPGDAYVDILGLDDYHDVKPENDPTELTRRLKILVELAEEKGKVAAMTETGLEAIPEENWWTERLLKHIKSDSTASQIAWILVWRNAHPTHHYAPYPEHTSAPDFVKFTKDAIIMMEETLPNMYQIE